jgi:hypothetical protein
MRLVCFCWVAVLAGCSDSGSGPSERGGPGGTGGSSSDAGATGGGAGSSSNTGGTSGATGGSSGAPTEDLVELPPGSRELDGIVNLVDAEAAQQLEEFLFDQQPRHIVLRQGLTKPLNLFLDHYLESYDFVFFVTDHVLDGVSVAGKFEAINRRAVPGGGDEIEIAAGGYKTSGRVKGVIGIPYRDDYYPPLSHEVGHYWAAHLDPRFGFGAALNEHHGPHWGFSSVNGQLGGFDGSTLRCETPAGAMPPGCTPLGNARTRYVVGAFGPNANGFRGQPFAPLELYLMGLLPAADVPASFQLLTDAQIVPDSYNEATDTLVVEASGITALPFANIVARHGQVEALEEASRHFSAAFVVVSATPAPDGVLSDVVTWAAAFGAREVVANWDSFERDTGGRATMDTLLGSRRPTSTPAPAPRERFACDVLAQDCGRPELACYLSPPSLCALSGGVGLDQPCDAVYACGPGLDCVASSADPTAYVCKPYCDLNDITSPRACQTLCANNYLTFLGTTNELLGALCLP